jgi:hypothetical protein
MTINNVIYLAIGSVYMIIAVTFFGHMMVNLVFKPAAEVNHKPTVVMSIVASIAYIIGFCGNLADNGFELSSNLAGSHVATILGDCFYTIGKYCVSIVFLFRLMAVFNSAKCVYSFNNRQLYTIYAILGIQLFAIICITLGQVIASDGILTLGAAIYLLFDVIFNILFPYLFVRKLLMMIQQHRKTFSNLETEIAQAEQPKNNAEITITGANAASVLAPTGTDASKNSKDSDENAKQHQHENSDIAAAEVSVTPRSPPDINQNQSKVALFESEEQRRENRLLSIAVRITTLSLITFVSSFLITSFAYFMIGGSGQAPWAITTGETLRDFDGLLNIICVGLCFTFNNNLYVQLCSGCQNYFQSKQLFSFFQSCCGCCDGCCCCGYFIKSPWCCCK